MLVRSIYCSCLWHHNDTTIITITAITTKYFVFALSWPFPTWINVVPQSLISISEEGKEKQREGC